MKKILCLAALASLVASQSFAVYMVVLRDGTRYRARSRWTVTNGKALLPMENGTTLQLDPSLIDVARTEAANKAGLGDARVLTTAEETPAPSSRPAGPSPLGSRIRTPTATTPSPVPPKQRAAPVAPPADPSGGNVDTDVLSKFSAAYDNIGVFDSKVYSPARNTVRVELTADSEDKVFKTISATSYMMLRIPGARIDVVELFMATINGGTAGRFQITREDAEKIDKKQISMEMFFVTKVIF